jgi:RND family efflux transporter MFP subunit
MKTLKRAAFVSLLGAGGAGMLTACKTSAPAATPVPTVPVAMVGKATLANDLTLTGEFVPYQDVDVMAKVAGYVRSINVDIGDHVKQGQVLAVLEAPEIQSDVARAKAGVAAAQANIVTAEAAVQRAGAAENMTKLSFQRIQDVANKDKGLVPRQEIDVAQSRQMEASAQSASANSGVQAAREAKAGADQEYIRAQTMMGYTVIRAPFAGVVTKRYASTGSMIQAGIASQSQAMPVVRLAQNSTLRLILPLPVNDVGGLKNGQPVEVVVSSLGRTLQGTVTRSADSVATATRTMDTEVDIPNKDGLLVAGMYAEVNLHLAARADVLSVPLDAVDGLGTSVQQAYVVHGGTIHLVNIKTGIQTANRVEIVSGLQQGDKVVVGRHTGLSDGEQVDAQSAGYENNTHN